MKKAFFFMAIASIGAVAFAAGASHWTYMGMYTHGYTPDGNYVSMYSYKYSDGNEFVDFYGYNFGCYGYATNLAVNSNAKFGTVSFNTAEMTCNYGSPPATEVSFECVDNGQYSRHGVSNGTTRYGDGTMYKGHYNYWVNEADCMVFFDGMPLELSGGNSVLEVQKTVSK